MTTQPTRPDPRTTAALTVDDLPASMRLDTAPPPGVDPDARLSVVCRHGDPGCALCLPAAAAALTGRTRR